MEKELGVPKPGDLLIGVIDFFAVLVPGIIAAGLLIAAIGATPEPNTLFVFGFTAAGWVLGHLLHGIGSWLDPLLYDRLFKPQDVLDGSSDNQRPVPKSNRVQGVIQNYLHKNDNLFRLAKEMTDFPNRQKDYAAAPNIPGGMYQWARAWLNSRSPEATARLDRLEADSKLFRSLAVLFVIAIPVMVADPSLITFPPKWNVPIHARLDSILSTFAGVIFSLWRYCDLRNKMIRQCYLYYVQLRFESRNARAASTACSD